MYLGRLLYMFFHFVLMQNKKPHCIKGENLKNTTFRTHGGLHVDPDIAKAAIEQNDPKRGYILINDDEVDNIDLMKPMLHGTDYGF